MWKPFDGNYASASMGGDIAAYVGRSLPGVEAGFLRGFFQWICHGLILGYPVESLKTGDALHYLAQSRFPETGTTLRDDFPIASDAGIA
jgi:hypothetical protein